MRALRTQIPRKLKGVMPSGAPFVLGAALAGRTNRRATELLAERIRSDLRGPDPAGRAPTPERGAPGSRAHAPSGRG